MTSNMFGSVEVEGYLGSKTISTVYLLPATGYGGSAYIQIVQRYPASSFTNVAINLVV